MSDLRECMICGFSDGQESIIETEWGWAHRECVEDQEREIYPHRKSFIDDLNEETREEKDYNLENNE